MSFKVDPIWSKPRIPWDKRVFQLFRTKRVEDEKKFFWIVERSLAYVVIFKIFATLPTFLTC